VTGGQFHFPVGYNQFHKDQVFGFQLTLWYSLGYTRFEDMQEVGQRINTFEEYTVEPSTGRMILEISYPH
jgi:hypothetical protein